MRGKKERTVRGEAEETGAERAVQGRYQGRKLKKGHTAIVPSPVTVFRLQLGKERDGVVQSTRGIFRLGQICKRDCHVCARAERGEGEILRSKVQRGAADDCWLGCSVR